jgi:hypothetical protein
VRCPQARTVPAGVVGVRVSQEGDRSPAPHSEPGAAGSAGRGAPSAERPRDPTTSAHLDGGCWTSAAASPRRSARYPYPPSLEHQKATFVLGSAPQGKRVDRLLFRFCGQSRFRINESGSTATEAVARLWLTLHAHVAHWPRGKAIALRSRGISPVGKAYRLCIVRRLT